MSGFLLLPLRTSIHLACMTFVPSLHCLHSGHIFGIFPSRGTNLTRIFWIQSPIVGLTLCRSRRFLIQVIPNAGHTISFIHYLLCRRINLHRSLHMFLPPVCGPWPPDSFPSSSRCLCVRPALNFVNRSFWSRIYRAIVSHMFCVYVAAGPALPDYKFQWTCPPSYCLANCSRSSDCLWWIASASSLWPGFRVRQLSSNRIGTNDCPRQLHKTTCSNSSLRLSTGTSPSAGVCASSSVRAYLGIYIFVSQNSMCIVALLNFYSNIVYHVSDRLRRFCNSGNMVHMGLPMTTISFFSTM